MTVELPDLGALTLDRLTKLKKSLNEGIQTHTRLRSERSGGNKQNRVDLAKQVVNNGLKVIGDDKLSDKSRKYVYEACVAGFTVLYERSAEYMVEKLHLSLILKLIEVDLVCVFP